MTLRGILSSHPREFLSQTWYAGEAFLDYEGPPVPSSTRSPIRVDTRHPPTHAVLHAVTLAELYLREPDNRVWHSYMWTADMDSQGQRVYVGGVSNTGKFEVHRHIHLTERFGVPTWR